MTPIIGAISSQEVVTEPPSKKIKITSTFIELPHELLNEILDGLNRSNLRELRLVNKKMRIASDLASIGCFINTLINKVDGMRFSENNPAYLYEIPPVDQTFFPLEQKNQLRIMAREILVREVVDLSDLEKYCSRIFDQLVDIIKKSLVTSNYLNMGFLRGNFEKSEVVPPKFMEDIFQLSEMCREADLAREKHRVPILVTHAKKLSTRGHLDRALADIVMTLPPKKIKGAIKEISKNLASSIYVNAEAGVLKQMAKNVRETITEAITIQDPQERKVYLKNFYRDLSEQDFDNEIAKAMNNPRLGKTWDELMRIAKVLRARGEFSRAISVLQRISSEDWARGAVIGMIWH